MRDTLLQALSGREERALEFHTALTACKAVGPSNGGPGEWEKADWLERRLREYGVTDIEHADAPDSRVDRGSRPNIIARMAGKSDRMLWIIAHLDVVPPGEPSLWHSDPWTVVRDEADPDIIRGRGVEDNQQALVAGALIAAELAEWGVTPDIGFGLIMVSDEETGNSFGADYLFKQMPDLVSPTDLVVVPDFGSADGSLLEIAEKGVLWVKVTVTGRQCHGSTPDEGINTLVAASDMIIRLKPLEKTYDARDSLFQPDRTTITPTRHDANVPNVNTIPGQDVFYIDCRVLPAYSLKRVLDDLQELADSIAKEHHVQVELEVVNEEPVSPPTPPDSPVVIRLTRAVREIYGIQCQTGGVGGSTVAAALRRKGVPTAVWARVIPNFHQPNEATRLSYTLGDARVFASMLFDSSED